ncbi:MAG: Ig-like domain-containing protein [Blastocatellia bacterium]|nr:Ig-like domain-containing protein [Blastocatellia bacterium]
MIDLRIGVLSIAVLMAVMMDKPLPANTQGAPSTLGSIVSAASFEGPVTSEGIVAIFGSALADVIEIASTSPLPTKLADRAIKVRDSLGVERDAPLFFVSPLQVNCVIPKDTAIGIGTVTIVNTKTNLPISLGSVSISKSAAAIFTANATGKGVPAALVLRIKSSGEQSYEPLSYRDVQGQRFVPLPIKPPLVGERVFLILYLSGLRGIPEDTVKVLFGGESVAHSGFAPAPGFTGLDQLNVEIPSSLFKRGRMDVAVSAAGFKTSNVVVLETGCPAGSAPPQLGSFTPSQVQASEPMTISGTGFDLGATNNLVRIQGVEAKVLSVSNNQLTIRVPFGAESGPLNICTPHGEGSSLNPVSVKTSISGFVEDTRQQPIAGVKVRLVPASLNIETTTNAEGSFILSNVPPSPTHVVEIDGSKPSGALPFPKPKLSLEVMADRDNAFPYRISLQQDTGPSLQITTSPTSASLVQAAASLTQQTGNKVIQTEGIYFEVADGTIGNFPEAPTDGKLTLTAVENSRTPTPFPPGIFSSSVAQITPFNVRLTPGAKLTFPNRDNLPPGTQATLYRFDQRNGSNTIGRFIVSGTALVSADGKRIETAQNAITDTSIYFIGASPSTTTVIGRVLDSDNETPVRLARVISRGQEAQTDGNGGFLIRNVIASQGDFLTVDASFQRSNGKVDRTQTVLQQAIVNGVMDVGVLKLSAENSNRPPTILAPATVAININENNDLKLVVSDPDPGQTLTVAVSGANFATLISTGLSLYTLRLSPKAGDGGIFTLTVTAIDNQGGKQEHKITLKVNRLPIAISQSVPLDEDTPRTFTLIGEDVDNDSLLYFIVNNPANGRLSGVAPNLTYTPNANYFGTDTFRFRVYDGTGDSDATVVTMSIRPINDPPNLEVEGGLIKMAEEGKELRFLITGNDVDEGDRLTFLPLNLPDETAKLANLNAISAEFRWTPNFDKGRADPYQVTFAVRDSSGLSDAKTVTIKVIDINQKPVLTVPGSQSVTSGQNLSFSISAIDPDAGQTLIFSANNLPEGATFNPTNKQFNWTPRFLQTGNYVLTFKANDNGSPSLSDEKTVSVTVSAQWEKAGVLEGAQVNAVFCLGANLLAGTEGGGIFRSSNQGNSWLQVLPNRSVRDFIATETFVFAATFGGGIFRSADQGQTWTQITPGPENNLVVKLALSGSTIYAGTWASGVYRSTDSGQNWMPVNKGLENLYIRSITVSDTTIFAGTDSDGLYRSTDQGQNWLPANIGLPNNSRIFALASTGNTIFAGTLGDGVFRSTNNGQSWVPINISPAIPGRILVLSLIVSGSNLFAGTSHGVFASYDDGQSLTSINSGLETTVLSVAKCGDTLFAGTDGSGIFRLSNTGQSWAAINSGLTAMIVQALLVNNSKIYAGTKGNGIYISSDNGLSWASANTGLPPYQRIYALATNGSDIFAGTDGLGVYRSSDQGRNWSPINNGLISPNILALIVIDNDLYAATYGGIFRFANQSLNWTLVNSGLENKSRVRSFTGKGTTLFAGTDGDGVFVLANKGGSWAPANSGLTQQNILALIIKGMDLFAGTYDGVFRSPDQGNNWVQFKAGLTDSEIPAFAVDGINLFAGTGTEGVFLLSEESQNWRALNSGLTITSIRAIVIDGRRIFAGTAGGGVFVGR